MAAAEAGARARVGQDLGHPGEHRVGGQRGHAEHAGHPPATGERQTLPSRALGGQPRVVSTVSRPRRVAQHHEPRNRGGETDAAPTRPIEIRQPWASATGTAMNAGMTVLSCTQHDVERADHRQRDRRNTASPAAGSPHCRCPCRSSASAENASSAPVPVANRARTSDAAPAISIATSTVRSSPNRRTNSGVDEPGRREHGGRQHAEHPDDRPSRTRPRRRSSPPAE